MIFGVIGVFALPFLLLFFLIPLALLSCVFWIWMLISAIKNTSLGETERICWVLVIVLLHFIGALLYLLIAPANTGRRAGPA